jgi:hypothetical protein
MFSLRIVCSLHIKGRQNYSLTLTLTLNSDWKKSIFLFVQLLLSFWKFITLFVSKFYNTANHSDPNYPIYFNRMIRITPSDLTEWSELHQVHFSGILGGRQRCTCEADSITISCVVRPDIFRSHSSDDELSNGVFWSYVTRHQKWRRRWGKFFLILLLEWSELHLPT